MFSFSTRSSQTGAAGSYTEDGPPESTRACGFIAQAGRKADYRARSRINLHLTNAPRNQLRVLRAEIENDNWTRLFHVSRRTGCLFAATKNEQQVEGPRADRGVAHRREPWGEASPQRHLAPEGRQRLIPDQPSPFTVGLGLSPLPGLGTSYSNSPSTAYAVGYSLSVLRGSHGVTLSSVLHPCPASLHPPAGRGESKSADAGLKAAATPGFYLATILTSFCGTV